jgi:Lrp/AsnC family transcriptional regulator, leucine-responsive regulatory protein
MVLVELMVVKPDKMFLQLLFELDRDARQSSQQIARKLRVSKDVVLYRTKQLEREKLIEGYYTVIDFSKLGYFMVRVYLKIQDMTPKQELQLIGEMMKNKVSFTVYKTEGNWDLAIAFLVRSFAEFYRAWEDVEQQYRRFILKKQVSILFEYIHYRRNYLVEKTRQDTKAFTTGNGPVIKLDKGSLRLLNVVAANARMSAVAIAQQLGMSASAVSYKLRQLEKRGVIVGYRAMVDFGQLGYEYYKVDVDLEDVSQRGKIRSHLRLHSNVVYEDITIGGSDVEFDIEVKTYNEFKALMDELRAQFPGVIRSYTYYKATKIHKYLYMPEATPKTI